MPKAERAVFRIAIFSRLLLLALIIVWRSLFPPYDSSARLNPSCLSSSSTAGDSTPLAAAAGHRVLWPWVGAAIEGSVVWDGVYFVRIAECGYEYEQTYAFQPLLPLCIAFLTRSVLAPLVPVIGYRAVLALSGYLLNNVAFVLAVVYFYRLSVLILKDSTTSLQAVTLFCFNPASVFYSSIYSESLYALSSLGGIFYLFSGYQTLAMILLAISGAARSNGAINAGYFCFKALLQTYDAIIQKKGNKLVVWAVSAGVARAICVFVPFAAFQAYGYHNLCVHDSSNDLRPWCKSRIPDLYSYVQSHYWGIGFLRYFQVKQLPNFLLAFPILSIAVASIIRYATLIPQTLHPLNVATRNTDSMLHAVGHNQNRVISSDSWLSSQETGTDTIQRRKNENSASSRKFDDLNLELDAFFKLKQGYCSILVLPFILHLIFMTFMVFFVMHVQVATRFLSASPPIYWFASYVTLSPGTTSRRAGYVIWCYFIAYILVGSLLFSNFYPFT
ncbi:phosphatidylinositol glycan, class V [Apostasia shenzhenica]|uniref:GPI mannosyltransferase 2 n=1 Tax=Apostasia shenzhenica TaxID=1088818 RepID=A0A2H9ZV24_9ASPA|nr:phosphatidylinositol glycan, class V [Apostasia shenzhenica]